MTFGDKLKKYREEHGISQEQLGILPPRYFGFL